MSLLVVGLSPPQRAGQPARAGRARPRTRRPSCSHDTVAAEPRRRGRGARHLQPGRGLRRRGQVPRAASPSCPTLLAQHSGVGAGRAHPAPLRALRGPGRPPPVLGGLRARLDGRRREPDPRPDQGRAARRRRSCDTAGRLLNDLFQQALRVGKRAHTETGIDRAGQSLVTVGLERGRARARRRWPGATALVVGAGSMGALAAHALLARPASASSSSPTAPSTAPSGSPTAVGGAARAARPACRDALAERRRRRLLHRRGRARRLPRRPACRAQRGPRRAGRSSCSTWRCRATSTPAAHDCPA